MGLSWDRVEDLWPSSVLGDGWYGMPRLVKRLLAVLCVPFRARSVLDGLIGRRWKRGDLVYADKRVEFETGLTPAEIDAEIGVLVGLNLVNPVQTEDGTAYDLEPLVERVEEALADGRIAPYPKRRRKKQSAAREADTAKQGESATRDSRTRDAGGVEYTTPFTEKPRSTPGSLRARARGDNQDTIGRLRGRER